MALTANVLSTPNTAVRTEKGIVSTVMRPASTAVEAKRVSETSKTTERVAKRTLRDIENVVDDEEERIGQIGNCEAGPRFAGQLGAERPGASARA